MANRDDFSHSHFAVQVIAVTLGTLAICYFAIPFAFHLAFGPQRTEISLSVSTEDQASRMVNDAQQAAEIAAMRRLMRGDDSWTQELAAYRVERAVSCAQMVAERYVAATESARANAATLRGTDRSSWQRTTRTYQDDAHQCVRWALSGRW